MAKYKNIFFDLDDTLWAFSENSRDAFEEVYLKFKLDAFFDSFEHYYSLYQQKNSNLWDDYAKGKITKSELNDQRFLYPLQMVGVNDSDLSRRFSDEFFSIIHTKKKLMPYAANILEYLKPKYNLYIISNGFRELQNKKMRAAGIENYFKKVILSDDIGIMKPYPEIFHFALSATQSDVKNSIMIGDNWDADITGAKGVGMDQVYYNVERKTGQRFNATFVVDELIKLKEVL